MMSAIHVIAIAVSPQTPCFSLCSQCSPVCLPLFVLSCLCVLQCVWAWSHLLSPLALIIVHTCLQLAHPSCRSAQQPLNSPSACSVSTSAL